MTQTEIDAKLATLSDYTETLYRKLIDGGDGWNGEEWYLTYLDNSRDDDANIHEFRARLAALSNAGLYRPVDGFAWGEVRRGAR